MTVDKGEMSVKQAIGEEREKALKKKNSNRVKTVDINKISKQILNLLKNIDEEIKKGNGIAIGEDEQEYLKKCVGIIKSILGQRS